MLIVYYDLHLARNWIKHHHKNPKIALACEMRSIPLRDNNVSDLKQLAARSSKQKPTRWCTWLTLLCRMSSSSELCSLECTNPSRLSAEWALTNLWSVSSCDVTPPLDFLCLTTPLEFKSTCNVALCSSCCTCCVKIRLTNTPTRKITTEFMLQRFVKHFPRRNYCVILILVSWMGHHSQC